MKKLQYLILLPLIVITLTYMCAMSFINTAESTVSITTPDALNISCITGFTRTAPRYCQSDATLSISWTDATACTARTLADAIPVGATVDLQLTWRALSNGATGPRYNAVLFWPDSGCATAYRFNEHGSREEVALVAGSEITRVTQDVFGVKIIGAPGQIYATQINAGGNGNSDILLAAVIGYYN